MFFSTLASILLSSAALADTVEIRVTCAGTESSWQQELVDGASEHLEVIELEGGALEVKVESRATSEGAHRYDFEFVRVQKRLLGEESREVFASPALTVLPGSSGELMMGAREGAGTVDDGSLAVKIAPVVEE